MANLRSFANEEGGIDLQAFEKQKHVNLQNDGDGTTTREIEAMAKKLKLVNFQCVMRDELKGKKPKNNECGIINLNTSREPGSHYCCWYKNGNIKYYFDSFGTVPPKEIIKYLGSPIMYSTYQIQQFNDTNCGEWCLYVLKKLNSGKNFTDVVLDIINE